MFKVSNKDTRDLVSLLLTLNISHFVLVFLLLTLNMQLPARLLLQSKMPGCIQFSKMNFFWERSFLRVLGDLPKTLRKMCFNNIFTLGHKLKLRNFISASTGTLKFDHHNAILDISKLSTFFNKSLPRKLTKVK